MTRFHVDLGDPPVSELPPQEGKLGRARSFVEFKSLKKAIRWAREEHEAGRWDNLPEIVDDNGDAIEINWDSPEWLTHAELVDRLNTAETSRANHRQIAQNLREEQAARDIELIKAGYIPVRVLAPHIREIRVDRSSAPMNYFGRDFETPAETHYMIDFQGFYGYHKQPDPFTSAIQALHEGHSK